MPLSLDLAHLSRSVDIANPPLRILLRVSMIDLTLPESRPTLKPLPSLALAPARGSHTTPPSLRRVLVPALLRRHLPSLLDLILPR